MGENTLVINHRELNYKGIFRSEDIFQLVNKVLADKGYSKNEKRSEEINTDEGRRFLVELRPSKVKATYLKLEMRMRISLDNVTSVVEERVGGKQRFELGSVHIIFDGWVKTDYQNRWTQNPYTFFFKAWINKYVYRWKLDDGYANEIFSDTAFMYGQLRSLFDSYAPKTAYKGNEKDVMGSVLKDVEKEVELARHEKNSI